MKRLISLALVLLLLLCTGTAGVWADDTDSAADGSPAAPESAETAAAAKPLEIRDAAGLRAMAEKPDGSYVLAANIDMAGETWTPIAFSGTLDGNGYAIYNVTITSVGAESETTVDGNEKTYDTVFSGFFSTLRDATVTDLLLRNVKVNVTSEENCFAALLSGFAERAVIKNCRFDGTVELHSSNIMAGVGGIVGFGIAEFENCAVDSTLIHVDGSDGHLCEEFAGGVIACGYCSINDCDVTVQGYVSCHGYVHDGGLVGMHHQHTHLTENSVVLYSTGNTVDGFISFFEDNADRRAYCDPYCGENLHWTMSLDQNTESFERREVFEYDQELLPHTCTDATFETAVSEPDCVDWGCTTYTCSECGYSYQDDYVAPVHQPGDWEVVTDATFTQSGTLERRCTICGTLLESKELPPHVEGEWVVSVEPSYDAPGVRQQFCADCGAVLAEEEIPLLIRSSSVDINAASLSLRYKDETDLSAAVRPTAASDTAVVWTSSDPAVVTVDEQGHVTAVHTGQAVITCESRDGGARVECPVEVRYDLSQWCVRIFLLGFLWY